MTDSARLDYLKGLGVNAIHLLPLQKYNPGTRQPYNWGYETSMFNVPENRYGTEPNDSAQNTREFKQMVQALHSAGLRVVMDVVYNHTVPSQGEGSAFWETIPYFWFRTDAAGNVLNESGVGNSMDDTHPMVCKFISDSLLFWTKEYKVDGFRFDEGGIFNPSSAADWSKTLRALRPDIILYGEPWTGGGPVRFGVGKQKGLDFAFFNGDFRDFLRGDTDGPRPGFMFGAGPVAPIEVGMLGSLKDFTQEPDETINYISCHDNMTLWDKAGLSMPNASLEERSRAVEFGYAILLLSQGVPFLEGGAEMGRTKGGNKNSYNAGDGVNSYKWSELPRYKPVVDFTSQLIRLRLEHPAFRIRDAATIDKAVRATSAGMPDGTFTIAIEGSLVGDEWKSILLIVHGRGGQTSVPLPPGKWHIKFNEGGPVDIGVEEKVVVAALSVTVLVKD